MYQKGQASVEYLLLLAVVATLAFTLYQNTIGFLGDPEQGFFSVFLDQFGERVGGGQSGSPNKFKNFSIGR